MTKKKPTTREQAEAIVEEARKQAVFKFDELKKLSDQYGVPFDWNCDGSYGTGATYYPNPARAREWPGKAKDYRFIKEEDGVYVHDAANFADSNDEGAWQSSTQDCI